MKDLVRESKSEPFYRFSVQFYIMAVFLDAQLSRRNQKGSFPNDRLHFIIIAVGRLASHLGSYPKLMWFDSTGSATNYIMLH